MIRAYAMCVKYLALWVVVASLVIASSASAALVNYDFSSNPATPTVSDPNVSASNVTQTGGWNISGGNHTAYIANTNIAGANEAGAISAGDYMEITLIPAVGYKLNLSSLTYDYGYSSESVAPTATYNYFVRSTAESPTYATTLAGSQVSAAQLTSNGNPVMTIGTPISLGAAYQGLNVSTTFRFYVYKENNPSSFARMDNIVIEGAAVQVPEPASIISLMGVGGLALLKRRRGKA